MKYIRFSTCIPLVSLSLSVSLYIYISRLCTFTPPPLSLSRTLIYLLLSLCLQQPTAAINAVAPSPPCSVAFTSAPASSKTTTTFCHPRVAAMVRYVRPFPSRAPTVAPALQRMTAMSAYPQLAHIDNGVRLSPIPLVQAKSHAAPAATKSRTIPVWLFSHATISGVRRSVS